MELIHRASHERSVQRLEFTSLIGKLQFCCLAVLPGQARVRPVYAAQDSYNTFVGTVALWLPDVHCHLGDVVVDALR